MHTNINADILDTSEPTTLIPLVVQDRARSLSFSPDESTLGSGMWKVLLANPQQSAFLREVIADHNSNTISIDSHVKRERELAEMPHARKAIKRYILVPSSDSAGTDIRSSITLADSQAFVAIPGKAVMTIPALYAGTAATPLHHRQKGYALTLLNDLKEILKPQKGQYSIIQWYSEADALFARLNPKWTDSLNCFINTSLEFASDTQMSEVHMIMEDEIQDFLQPDTILLKKEVEESANETGKAVICIIPDSDCVKYRCAEGRLALTYSKNAPSTPSNDWKICGAYLKVDGVFAFILWRLTTKNVNTQSSYLRVIRLRFGTTDQLRQLLTAAVIVSRKFGCNGNIRWRAKLDYKADLDELKIKYDVASNNDTVASRLDFGGDSEEMAQSNIDHNVWSFEQYIMG